MSEHETLTFKIDTGWLTDFIRKRVYYEGVDFSEGVRLITECLPGVDRATAIAVLSGTKRFQGINEAEVVDDNATEEYLKYLGRIEKNSKTALAEIDICANPLKYLDPFAVVRSISKYKEECDRRDEPPTMYSMRKWFQEFCPNDKLFEGGLYSVSLAFVEKPIRAEEDQEEFYDYLYGYWNRHLEGYAGELSEEDRKRIQLRQRKYEFYREKKEKGLPIIEELLANYKKKEEPKALSGEEFYTIDVGEIYSYEEKNPTYLPMPEGQFTRYGLIAPNGDFYSCEFGAHASASIYLCEQLRLSSETVPEGERLMFNVDRAKDELYNRGWIFVYSGGHMQEPFFSKYGSQPEDFPKKQFDTAYSYIVWEREVQDS